MNRLTEAYYSTAKDQRTSDMLLGLASGTLSLHEEDTNNTLQQFALNMLYRLILAEEHFSKRPSCMRIFVRMDISVLQTEGKFHYMINELTHSHQTGLFLHWGGSNMDYSIQDLANVLHFVAHRARLHRY